MADLVRYASSTAQKHHKRFQRIGAAVRAAGSRGSKSIIDGYIVSTTADRNSSVTKVIDTPVIVLLCGYKASHMRFSAVPMPFSRDGVAPNLVAAVTPVPDGGIGEYEYTLTPKYIGIASAPQRVIGSLFGMSPPTIGAEWACSAAAYTWANNVPPLYSTDNITVQGVRWSSPLHGAITPPVSEGTIELTITGETLAAMFPGYHASVRPFSACTTPAACAADYKDEEGRKVTRLYVCLVMHDETPAAIRSLLVVLCIAMVAGRPQAVAWTRTAALDDASYTGATSGPHCVTVRHVRAADPSADEIIVECSSHDQGSGETAAPVPVTLRANALTGAGSVQTTTGVPPSFRFYVSTTDTATWGVCDLYHDRPYGALLRVRDGVSMHAHLPGWLPVVQLPPPVASGGGYSPSYYSNWYRVAQSARFVTRLSAGRVGVLVIAQKLYASGEVIPVHLLEVDEDTLGIISVRGVVGEMLGGGVVTFGMHELTTVTPQVLAPDGVTVLVPAVLLSNLLRTTRLSTDGGYTWTVLSSVHRGTPVYMGNRLHPFIIGESL